MSEHRIVRILTRITDLILLNVLWVISSLPVVTIGAATTALYTVTIKMTANEEGYIVKDYIRAFKSNFKQSTIVWLLLIITGMGIALDIRFWTRVEGSVKVIGWGITAILGMLYSMEFIFVFPLIAKFENKTINHVRNGLMIPVVRLPFALIIWILTGACVCLTLFNVRTIMTSAMIWTSIGVALLAYANSFILKPMLRPFC